jgi:hypothetical protein
MPYPASNPLAPSFHGQSYSSGAFFPYQQPTHAHFAENALAVTEHVRLYVPKAVIGAIIGTKGQFIKSIIKSSSATIKVLADA